ncbi:MAG: hypothetical protein ACKPKO_32240, partial [Candidatus Fonsibacter sp.]
GKADDARHQRVQITVSYLHDQHQLQGTGAQGSGLPGRNLYYRLDGDRRGRRSIRPADPEVTPKRASGDKVAIQFKYCSHQLGVTEGQPSRERVLDQRALRQLRADPT